MQYRLGWPRISYDGTSKYSYRFVLLERVVYGDATMSEWKMQEWKIQEKPEISQYVLLLSVNRARRKSASAGNDRVSVLSSG